MEGILAGLETSAVAGYLRGARWGYAAVSAGHVLGIALLVGGILPLDAKLIGAWPAVDRTALARVLLPVATAGLALSIVTGLMLLSVRASEYAAKEVVIAKLALVSFGAMAALLAHVRYGRWLDRKPAVSLAHVGAISMLTWVSTLVLGRMIAFV